MSKNDRNEQPTAGTTNPSLSTGNPSKPDVSWQEAPQHLSPPEQTHVGDAEQDEAGEPDNDPIPGVGDRPEMTDDDKGTANGDTRP